MILSKDLNLDLVKFSSDGRAITMRFVDMRSGSFVGELRCSDCFHFRMQNMFGEDDGFACYVAEVRSELVEGEVLEKLLLSNKYPFRNELGAPVRSDLPCYWLQVEGGDVIVEVVCRSIESSLN